MTSDKQSAPAESKDETEVKMKHRPDIKVKLEAYESQCKRYNSPKVEMTQQCIREAKEFCNLDDYVIGSLQCQIMFDIFTRKPTTKLTSISLKNNHIEPFCCHSMSSFIRNSGVLKELNLQGCK